MPISIPANSINRRVRSGVSNRARLNISSALGGASVALLALSLTASPAQAADECGAAVAGVVTCLPGDNPYAGGIEYNPGVDDLTVVLEDGVNVTTAVTNGVWMTSTTGNLVLEQREGAIVTNGNPYRGVQMTSDDGNVTATVTNVETTGSSGVGVDLTAQNGEVTLTAGTVATAGATAHGVFIFGQDSVALSVADVATTGDAALGVQALSYGALSADIGQASTTGDDSRGLYLRADGAIDLSADSVTTTGANSQGVLVQGYSTGTTVTADLAYVSTQGADSNAVDITNSGSIDLTAGSVATAGANSMAVSLISHAEQVTAVIGTVETTGNFAKGIEIKAEDGIDLTVTGEVTTQGDQSTAVSLSTDPGGPVLANIARVETQGDSSIGISVDSKDSVDLTVGSISTAGKLSRGILITAKDDVDLTVTGDIQTLGDGSFGATAFTDGGDINASFANISTAGDGATGVYLTNYFGAAAVTVTNVATAGDNATGIEFAVEQDGLLTVTGDVTTQGEFATGVYLDSSSGSLAATLANVTTTGRRSDGIHLEAETHVDLTVTGTVRTEGEQSDGVNVYSAGSAVATIANVSTTGVYADGIAISANQDIALTITGAVTTTGDRATGVDLYSGYGSVTATIANISTTGYEAVGISIQAETSAELTVTGAVETLGDYATAVDIFSSGTTVATIASASTEGYDAPAINISGYDGATLTVTGEVSTLGDKSGGVSVASYDGLATATIASVTTAGDRADGVSVGSSYGSSSATIGDVVTTGASSTGVFITGNTSAQVVVTGEVSTQGYEAHGVYVTSDNGAASATVANVSTAGQGATGVVANSNTGTASATVANVTTTGVYAHGVAVAALQHAEVTVTGQVSTAGTGAYGVVISSGGDLTLNVTGSVETSGVYAAGVVAYGGDGATNVTVANVTTTGDGAIGIFVGTAGNATLQVGNVSAAEAQAVLVTGYGDIVVTTTGDVTSGITNAIEVQTAELATVNVAAGSSVTGATNAIGGGGTKGTVINNAGTLNAGSAATIVSLTGPVTLNNSGTLHGHVEFGAGDDVVNNSGLFQAVGTSDFGAGTNSFVNSGTLTAQNAAMVGLQSFTNSGLITLSNGAVGDVLALSGDYTGAGGRLAVDVDFAAGTADLLTIAGAASGTTAIAFNPVGGSASLGAEVRFADAGAGSSADAFTAEQFDTGAYRYEVTFDAPANDYMVRAGLGDGALRTVKFNEGAQSLWYKTADVLTAYLANARYGGEGQASRGRVWGQLHGSYDTRDQTISYSDALGARNIDLDYRQDYFGGQIGVDLGALDSGFAFGLTGGYANSILKFTGTNDRAKYDAFNFGVYSGFNSGNLFASALAKYDFYNIKAENILGDHRASFNGHSYGIQGEFGVRFGSDKLFVEPVISLAWLRTDLDRFNVLDATIDFDKLDGLRGKIGARVGGNSNLKGGTITWYVGGQAVKEFEGKDGVTFRDGANSVHLVNQRIGTYGQADIGVNIASPSGVTGFFEVNGKFGNEYRGYGGRAGIRLPF